MIRRGGGKPRGLGRDGSMHGFKDVGIVELKRELGS